MTLEDKKNVTSDGIATKSRSKSEEHVTPPTRDKPMMHPAVDPPLCQVCRSAELSFFDPNCPTCQDLLLNPATTIPQMFAILRQWTPQTQQHLEMIVREVLKRGANANDRDGLTDMTLLHYTAKAGAQGIGDVDEACRMATLLLQKGADVFVRCRWTNMTALHYAVYFDVAPVVKILLEHSKGIDVDSKCTEFEHGTSLHMAAANLAYESAKVLLQNHANAQAKDGLERTPQECVPDDSNFDAESDMGRLVHKMKQLLQEPPPELFDPVPTSGPNMAAELEALGLAIGERVMVGGVKCGILRFCGPTKFSAGIWAGIELEEPAGKNDGSVAGVSYFKCSPKYGIFAPLGKLGKPGIMPSPSAAKLAGRSPGSLSSKSAKKVNVTNVKSRIDTGLRRSMSLMTSSPLTDEHLEVGERVIVGGHRRGVIRYSGKTDFAPGWWYGLELEKPDGKNDGSVNGKQYFTCKPRHGVFAPPTRVQKYTEMGSRESLESFSSMDRQRRLSAGNASGSQGNLSTSTTSAAKKQLVRQHSKSKLHSISENSKRPKTAGTIGQMKRSMSQPSGLQATPPQAQPLKLSEGLSVFCNNELGVIRYMGGVDFAEGTWLGVELRSAKGKNDGSVQGKRYFTCKPNHGLIVRPSKVTVRGINGAKLLSDPATSPTPLDISQVTDETTTEEQDNTQNEKQVSSTAEEEPKSNENNHCDVTNADISQSAASGSSVVGLEAND